MKYDDLYGDLDRDFLQEKANRWASYEGGHHVRQETTTTGRDYDPVKDDTTTRGRTCN